MLNSQHYHILIHNFHLAFLYLRKMLKVSENIIATERAQHTKQSTALQSNDNFPGIFILIIIHLTLIFQFSYYYYYIISKKSFVDLCKYSINGLNAYFMIQITIRAGKTWMYLKKYVVWIPAEHSVPLII